MAKGAGSVLEAFVVAAAIAGAFGGMPSAGAEPVLDVATITGFSIPEVDDKGQLKWKVLGESARLKSSGGAADITHVRMEIYKNSNLDMVLTAPQCLFDRDKREAESEAPVQITGRNITITGNGFFWSGTNNLLVIRQNAKVVVTDSKSFVKEAPENTETNQPAEEAAK